MNIIYLFIALILVIIGLIVYFEIKSSRPADEIVFFTDLKK